MDHKTLHGVEIKSVDEGRVQAVFSSFNVKDAHSDVTLPDAFEDGAPVLISSYNHTSWQGARPVGKGTIRVTKSDAVLDGQFFMDTTDGRETFAVVKALAESGLGEWSYGFEALDSAPGKFDGEDVNFLKKLKVYEVSPVLRGAGVNTRTLAVKALVQSGLEPAEASRLAERTVVVSEYKAAIRPHDRPAVTKAWDGKQVVDELLPDGSSIEDLRSVFAWADPHGDPEAKNSYRFPHHHGPHGEANLRACLTTISDLNTGKADIPDEDRRGVYNHMASHLRDADREPPELRAADEHGQLTFQDEGDALLSAISRYIDRATSVMALRAEKNKSRQLAAASVDRLDWIRDDVRRLSSLLDSPQDDAAREYLRFIQSTQPPTEDVAGLPDESGEQS